MVFSDTYEDAWKRGYRDLEPANLYNVDYSLLGTARVEPLIRRIRNEMAGAGMEVENSKGECNFGQHEINFHYGEALRTADDHAIYKNGAKEIAAPGGHGAHLHGEVQRARGQLVPHPLLAGPRRRRQNVFGEDEAMFDRFVAGQIACMRELTLLFAPQRELLQALRQGLVRADRGGVGPRQPHVLAARGRARAVAADREPPARRRREPLPGPRRDDRRRPARDRHRGRARARRCEGNAYESDAPEVPHNLYAARELFADSEVAREAFGQEVVDHYLNRAQVELEAHEAAVTDWERIRGFERL